MTISMILADKGREIVSIEPAATLKSAATLLAERRIGAVVILQLLFTYTTPFQALFGNQAIPLRIWPWLLAGGFAFFLVVEAEKLVIRSSASLRRTITAVEAGA